MNRQMVTRYLFLSAVTICLSMWSVVTAWGLEIKNDGTTIFFDDFESDTVGSLPTIGGGDTGEEWQPFTTNEDLYSLTDVEDDSVSSTVESRVGNYLGIERENGVLDGEIFARFPDQTSGTLTATFAAQLLENPGATPGSATRVTFTNEGPRPSECCDVNGRHHYLMTGSWLSTVSQLNLPALGIADDDVVVGFYNGSHYDFVPGTTTDGVCNGCAGQWITVSVSVDVEGGTPQFTLNGEEIGAIPNATPSAGGPQGGGVPTIDGMNFGMNSKDGGKVYIDAANTAPTPTSFTWSGGTVGDWNKTANWSPQLGAPPRSPEHTAFFDSSATGPTNVVTFTDVSVNKIQFDQPTHPYIISGSGSVNLRADSLTTAPTIHVASGNHQFQVRVGLQKSTTVSVSSGSSLEFVNRISLNGNTLTKTGGGSMVISNTLNTGGGTVVNSEGIISGGGTVGGSVDNASGTLAPGNSPGILTISGDYTQGASGTLEIELTGTATGENGHDQLAVNGNATLDGTLDIQTDSGFTPGVGATAGAIGDQFVIVTAASVGGTFATIDGRHQGNGLFYDVAYNATNVTLGAFQAAAGDADGDKDVDITDFNTLSTNFDPSGANTNDWMTADFNGDGNVDITDFNSLSSNFAPSGYGNGPGQVPEPSSILLLLLGTLAGVRFFRW
ncbi:MAG: PEP-CTERM sorting domain-containing protein [Pirellulaceae bacterium]|nr:PEP-CTERM sorting domain-containing protein [Pirellulaceae bacterium]